jgi:hypothetical protein
MKATRVLVAALFAAFGGTANADLVILVDDSESSPAMRSDEFVPEIAPQLARQVAEMSTGERLVVAFVGDHSDSRMPVFDRLVLRRSNSEGATAKDYGATLPAFMAKVIGERRLKPAAKWSQLTLAVADARRRIRPNQPCKIVLLSDLAEYDSGVKYPKEWRKALPVMTGLDLRACKFRAIGAGVGIGNSAAVEAIIGHWRLWLTSAGAAAIDISP